MVRSIFAIRICGQWKILMLFVDLISNKHSRYMSGLAWSMVCLLDLLFYHLGWMAYSIWNLCKTLCQHYWKIFL
ncbi:unnamed protein product [Callosobruchus maculatus]|uniref:Uncharacterized protein n=1 Tax=Callosobruchus maculatus TaxID=64391 RepID=A0A653BVE7_CALMS|nr:unnamed protein product [Callosobruchus maculatus]